MAVVVAMTKLTGSKLRGGPENVKPAPGKQGYGQAQPALVQKQVKVVSP